MGTNKFASQQGMTAYGTRRHLYDPKLGTDQPLDQATISLQMGTNKGASQVCWGTVGRAGGALAPLRAHSLNTLSSAGRHDGARDQAADLRARAGHGAL